MQKMISVDFDFRKKSQKKMLHFTLLTSVTSLCSLQAPNNLHLPMSIINHLHTTRSTSLLCAVLFTKILPQTVQDLILSIADEYASCSCKERQKDDWKTKAPCDCLNLSLYIIVAYCYPSHWFQLRISTMSLGSDICFSWSLSDSEFPSASWSRKQIQSFLHHPKISKTHPKTTCIKRTSPTNNITYDNI